MITLTRAFVRQLHQLLRRSGLCKSLSPAEAFVQLTTSQTELRVRVASTAVAFEYHQAGTFIPQQLIIPVDLLSLIGGSSSEPVHISHGDQKIIVEWTDRGVPQLVERELPDPLPELPSAELPSAFTSNPPELWSALREAVATSDDSSTRYALRCLELRAATGDIAATDGQHVLIQGGFEFPWHTNILLPGIPLLGCKELAPTGSIGVGLTGEWVTLQLAPWTLSLKVDTLSRFPHVDDCFPSKEPASRLQITDSDAAFLTQTLPGLPADDNPGRVTLDLNGQVVLRAKGATASRTSELILSNSQLLGTPVRLSSNRRFLARAVQLGFRELHINSATAPIVCRDGQRRYCWALLSSDSVLPATEDPIVVSSPSESGAPVAHPTPELPAKVTPLRTPTASKQAGVYEPEPLLIEQLIALRAALRTASTAAGQWLKALQRQRRQSSRPRSSKRVLLAS